jgi:hypothetical protein
VKEKEFAWKVLRAESNKMVDRGNSKNWPYDLELRKMMVSLKEKE